MPATEAATARSSVSAQELVAWERTQPIKGGKEKVAFFLGCLVTF